DRLCSSPPARRSATWPRSAAMCCNGPVAAIFATLHTPIATNAFPGPAARRLMASIARMRCSALATSASPATRATSPRRCWRKIRDRESYEFALASAAVALDLDGGTVKQVRIALGGVAALPWRAKEAEAQLAGKQLDEQTIEAAATATFAQAQAREHNVFKVELGKRTLVRALHQAAALEI